MKNRLHTVNDSDTENPKSLYSEDGVDLTLIRWMLSLSYAERLDALRRNAKMITKLKNANKIR
ncbi:MAG: hypothetical protein R2941_07960 [Desulfobacterales bacterium]